MPRACPVETHALCYLAGNVNPPRGKPVASSLAGWMDREATSQTPPRGKPVASSDFEQSRATLILDLSRYVTANRCSSHIDSHLRKLKPDYSFV
jgi:hypothetical protein